MALSAGMKSCSRCRVAAPLDEFGVNRAIPDGRNIYCRSCLSEAGKKRNRRRSENPAVPASIKRCRKCQEEKASGLFARNRTSADGLQSYCKACTAKDRADRSAAGVVPPAEKACSQCRRMLPAAEYHRNMSISTTLSPACKDCSRKKMRIIKYRLDDAWISRVDAARNCEICNRAIEGAEKHIDHDHKTGRPRGVLCRFCNPMLGLADDNPAVLIAAAAYLGRFISESDGVTADAS